MEQRVIECVPNFSEGLNASIIKLLADIIKSVDGVKLLNVDSGYAANRTVYTFAGVPEAVAEAAFLSAQKAAELIDMTKHKGTHPRIGAIDVMPFVPVSGISMKEVVVIAREVARRIGEELNIPVFCYEEAAFFEERRNLARCRAGEYEHLEEKLKDPVWKPDFGPASFNAHSGAAVVGARQFLVAFNVNLDTQSVMVASKIAAIVRESGRLIVDEEGKSVCRPGYLKNVKAIGWYIDEYECAQVSMNLTDFYKTSVYEAFNEVVKVASEFNVKVTGSELIGMIPLKAILDSGRFFAGCNELTDEQLVNVAIEHLGLNDKKVFDPRKNILEYSLVNHKNRV